MIDFSNLPVSGSFIAAVALYTGASIAAGQIISTRMIERSGWQENCQSELQSHYTAQKEPEPIVPRTDCQSVIGWLHSDANSLCWQFGNPDLAGPAAGRAREAERHARALRNRKLSEAAANAPSHCACAADTFKREKFLSLGLYAGTARLVTPNSVEHMPRELSQALSSPYCTSTNEVRP